MNAVNLLPSAGRRRGVTSVGSVPFFGVTGVLVLVLIATVLYFGADNRVTSRQTELNQLTAGVDQWTSAADSYSRYSTEAQQHAAELSDVRQLASARFDWSTLLGQISALMPSDAQLASLSAQSPEAAAAATIGAPTGMAPTSAITLSACATSQPAVAQTMVQLRQITGIASVTLSSSQSSGSTSGSSTGGGCDLPVQFSLSLTFAASATPSTSATDTTEGTNAADTTTTASSTAPSGASSSAS